MCRVNCEEIVEGLIPAECVARIRSAEGRIEEVVVSTNLVAGNTIAASFIGEEKDKVLVELPRETASGRWRLWLQKSQVGE